MWNMPSVKTSDLNRRHSVPISEVAPFGHLKVIIRIGIRPYPVSPENGFDRACVLPFIQK